MPQRQCLCGLRQNNHGLHTNEGQTLNDNFYNLQIQKRDNSLLLSFLFEPNLDLPFETISFGFTAL